MTRNPQTDNNSAQNMSRVHMTLPTLHLLRRILGAQQMLVGDESFRQTAPLVLAAVDELDAAIGEAEAALK